MPDFEPNVPRALDSYLTPTAVAPSGQFAIAVLTEAKTKSETISDHSIPGAALLQGLLASRLSSAQNQGMDTAFLYATEWQATRCCEAERKAASNRKLLLWEVGGQMGRRVASKQEAAQLSAASGLQLLQMREASQALRLSLAWDSSADTAHESSAASAALVRVAATEQAGSLQSVEYLDLNSRSVFANSGASGDAFGQVSATGLQLLPKLSAERTQYTFCEISYSQADSAVISGGLGGTT